MTQDEMVGWHHGLNGHELEKTLGDSKGQGSLVCYSSWGHEDLLEKEMAVHSSILAWKIPWTEEPGELQSMGSQRVGRQD